MLRSALFSSSVTRFVSARLLTASAARYNQSSTTPDTKELEDLFMNTSVSKDEIKESNTNFKAAQEREGGRNRRFPSGINRVELLGGVAADPTFLVSRKGDDYAMLRLFTNVNDRRRDGSFIERVEVHDVAVFVPHLVSFLRSNVKRGSKIYITGNLHYVMRADGSRKTMVKAELIQCIAKTERTNKDQATESA